MPAQEDQALDMLQRFNLNLRKAILANFPCAYEQYVCISLPGTVIDTRDGGSYLPSATGITADHRNAINCNEAMLVDSMVPLDKVMLGPTGKSVTRSYATSLDMLVPRKTDVGTFDLSGGASQNPNSPEYKYTLAMDYLRRPAPGITAASRNDNDVEGAKDSLIEKGISASTVDMYVQKQLKWSESRVKWDAARNEAIEARESHPELQNAAAFSRRQKKLKSAQNELHARWMDWVVNGDKLKVDYCFAVVDRDTIMSRIERAKEATRDSMLSSIDGTEWAQVHLEPKHWASLCRSKARAWETRHPSNPAHTQLQLESLRSMRESYKAYSTQLLERSGAAPGGGAATIDPMLPNLKFPPATEDTPKPESTLVDVSEKATNSPDDAALQIKKSAYAAWDGETDAEKKRVAQWRIGALENPQILQTLLALNKPLDELEKAETELREAYDKMYECERETRKIPLPGTALADLEEAKKTWLGKRTKLQQAQASDSSAQLSAGGVRNLQTSIKSRLSSLNAEVQRLESRLARNSISGGDLPEMITGVSNKDNSIEKAKPDVGAESGARDEADSADVWTNISFTVNNKTNDHKQEEHGMSGSFHVEAQNWYASVRAESSFSKNDQKINDFMASCTVSGSFSAMVVNIKRPWLHAELFQDFDIDIPKGTFLSPGAKTIKHWVETGDTDYNGYVRTNYGKFPSYPTAFIVAADTTLSFKGSDMKAEEALATLQTDSSLQANYGCWGITPGVRAGGNLQTNDKNTSQHMEVKDGALNISFQAPQIIGWVSEILPELPRGDIPRFGGVNGAPMKGFRANL